MLYLHKICLPSIKPLSLLFSRYLLICFIFLKENSIIGLLCLSCSQQKHFLKTGLKMYPSMIWGLCINSFASQLYLECSYMIIPFHQHSPFLRIFLQGCLNCWKLALCTSAVWHWVLKNLSITKRKTCLTQFIFVSWMNFDTSTLLKSNTFLQWKLFNSGTDELYLPVVCPQRRFLKKTLRIQSIL